MQDQLAADPPELIEVMRAAEGRADRGQGLRRHHPFEAQIGLQTIAVVVAERIAVAGFEHLDRDSGGQAAIVEVLIARQLERRIVRRVEHVPGQIRAVVPHPGAARDGADVRPHHRVEPAPEAALGMVE